MAAQRLAAAAVTTLAKASEPLPWPLKTARSRDPLEAPGRPDATAIAADHGQAAQTVAARNTFPHRSVLSRWQRS